MKIEQEEIVMFSFNDSELEMLAGGSLQKGFTVGHITCFWC